VQDVAIIPTIWEYKVAKWAFALLMMVTSVREKQEQGWLNTKEKVKRRIEVDTTTNRTDLITYLSLSTALDAKRISLKRIDLEDKR
jgi:hypothetical protein